jgi:hypothetical protein
MLAGHARLLQDCSVMMIMKRQSSKARHLLQPSGRIIQTWLSAKEGEAKNPQPFFLSDILLFLLPLANIHCALLQVPASE